jgi:hypothetical protein
MRYAIGTILLTATFASAGEPASKASYERWDAAFVGGVRAGYVRTSATEEANDLTKGLVELRLRIVRINDTVTLGMDSGTYENADGLVTGVFMKQFLGQKQTMEIDGVVDGDKLYLTLNKSKRLDPAPWTNRAIGVARQQRLFREKKVGPGDEFAYLSFEPTINLVVTTRVFVKDYEDVELMPKTGNQKLLRVDVKADRIKDFQPPPLRLWLDDNREVVRSETEVGGLGELTLVKTTKAIAIAPPVVAAKSVEAHRIIPVKTRLANPHALNSAVYRITVKGDANAAKGVSIDGRQRVTNASGDTFDLTVQKGAVALAEKAGPEYLQSSHFINSADAKVRELAKRAVGIETDATKKARLIESYVKRNMESKSHELFATADHVARNLQGDCTEYAVLTAAMCRAEGIPARTAIGLVYGEVGPKFNQPAFIFHMWTEVWLKGQWIALDSTLGNGGIGPAHIKISDQSWHNEASMAPLLPTLNLLGKLSIEVVRAE